MKNWWKKVPYKTKAILNLCLVVVCAAILWARFDYPLPTKELEFRRSARENLVGQVTYLGEIGFEKTNFSGICVGTNAESVLFGTTQMMGWPRKGDEPTLAPVWESFFPEGAAILVAVDEPESAVSATLTATLGCNYQKTHGWGVVFHKPREYGEILHRWQKTFAAEGEPLKNGGFAFQIRSDYEYSNGDEPEKNVENYIVPYLNEWGVYLSPERYYGVTVDMEAIFYNANGEEVGRAALSNLT